MWTNSPSELGWKYDFAMKSWYSPDVTNKETGESVRLAVPPFGCTDEMLARGLVFEVKEGKLNRFSHRPRANLTKKRLKGGRIMLTGKAKTDYQREYMMKRRSNI
uniref:Uncharacterized protein n=1 Tax=viral metagenome TaxID=1070528 RepID=A0A6M3Y393_9ZZZZ